MGTGLRAVLFDWRGTLVHFPGIEWTVERALASIGRTLDRSQIGEMAARLEAAITHPEVVETDRTLDTDAALHRIGTMRFFELAGLDDELAGALYRFDAHHASHPLYPDVPATLAAIRDRGVRIAVVSDIHYDLRAEFDVHGVAELIDAVVLSFEQGIQKPDPRMFTMALEALDVAPHEALMVGDRASHDGGAAALGIPTLILPPRREFGPGGLDLVLRMLVEAPM